MYEKTKRKESLDISNENVLVVFVNGSIVKCFLDQKISRLTTQIFVSKEF